MSRASVILATTALTMAATLAWPRAARAFLFESVAPAGWQTSDTALGFSNPTVENFEDTTLVPGLTYQAQSRAIPDTPASATLPTLFDPATDGFGNAFAGSNWDGTRSAINTADNQSHSYNDASQWGRQIFSFAGGAARVGFSLTNLQKALTVLVNGTMLGTIPALPGSTNVALAGGRNGYLIITAEAGERIESITLENNANGDGWAVDHLLIQWTTAVVLFLPDDMAGAIFRYTVTPKGVPTSMGSIAASTPAGVAVSATGDLYTSDFGHSGIQWFRGPQGAGTLAGMLTDARLQSPEEMRFVDGELWVTGADLAGSTNPVPILRVGFDAGGAATVLGTVTTNLIGANRGMLWVPATRDLFVTQCCATSAIQHLRVSADRATTTALPAITGNGLANPHGMVMTSWGELLVANAAGDAVLRFIVDANGAARASGSITGNGLTAPIGLALLPWGELLAMNQPARTVSRFTFDANHGAVAAGTFAVGPAAGSPSRIGWMAIAPVAAACAPANSPACRGPGGTTDGGTTDGGRDGSVDAVAPVDATNGTDARDGALDAATDARADGGAARDAGAGAKGGGGCGCNVNAASGATSDLGLGLASALFILVVSYFRGRKMSVIASASGTSGKN